MKTRKSFKWILSLVLLTAIFSLSLASVAFADASTVTWKEIIGSSTSDVDQIPDGVGYNSETGTFTEGRTIVRTANSTRNTYYFGVELPTAVTSGRIVVNAEFSGVLSGSAYDIDIFNLSSESAGMRNTAVSGLSYKASGYLLSDATNYNANWNTDHSSVGETTGGSPKLEPNRANNLKLVATAADEEDNWTINVYDAAKPNEGPFYTRTILRSELSDIKYIVNSNYLHTTNNAQITIDKFQVTTATTPEIVTATDGNVAYNAPLKVTFDSAIDESTIREIKLMQGTTVVAADVTLDETTKKTVTIDPTSDLVDGEDYQIVIPATVKGANGLSVEATVINVTAIDALYFTNLASQYNPSAVVNEDHEPDRHSIENNKLVLGHGTKSMGMYKFVIPAAETGVYYADVKFSVINVNNNDDKVRLCAGSNDILVATGTTEFLAPSEAMNYAVNSSDANVYKSNGIYDLRFIIMSDSSSANWKVLLLNKATGAITHGGIISRENLAAFNQLYIEVTSCAAEVSEIVIRKADDVNLINPNYNSAAKQMTGTVATAKSGVAIAAAYAADGRFLQAVSTPLNPSSSAPDVINVTFTTAEAIAETKLMVWDGFTGCKPLLLNPFE